jgi:hypothetical protein
MKDSKDSFVTREHAKVDRIACAWLIKRFINPNAEILYVPRDAVLRVAESKGSLPFDIPGVELGHHGDLCSFDAFLKKYNLTDPALARLAQIVRGADTDNRTLTPESPGLYAIASGFHAQWGLRYANDHALFEVEFPLYDSLYEFCKTAAS